MKDEIKTEMLHFTVAGEWFTWILRHLWVEGNDLRAIRLWESAFPQLSTPELLKEYFLPIVSGKMKFIEDSDGEGFKAVKDNQKYFNIDRNDVSDIDTSLPLFDSFEDLQLIRKIQLFVKELELRNMQFSRDYSPSTATESMYFVDKLRASQENTQENKYRDAVASLYSDIKNMCYKFDLECDPILLPTIISKFDVLEMKSHMTNSSTKTQFNRRNLIHNKNMFESLMSTIEPHKKYFVEKYGTTIFLGDYETAFHNICNLDTRLWEDFSKDALVEGERFERDMEENPPFVADKKSTSVLDTTDYITSQLGLNQMVREGIKPISITECTTRNGWLSPKGRLYECTYFQHLGMADIILETVLRKESDGNAEHQLEKLGWVKMQNDNFFYTTKEIKSAQRDAIFDYISKLGVEKFQINFETTTLKSLFESVE